MMEPNRDALGHPRARITGIVYLLYFLTAILGQILTGRGLVGYGLAANLIATGFYFVLTLLFYVMFRPWSRSRISQSTAAELTSIYWHFMDGLWIFLFALLTLGR